MFLWDGQQAYIFSNSIRVVGKFIPNLIYDSSIIRMQLLIGKKDKTVLYYTIRYTNTIPDRNSGIEVI